MAKALPLGARGEVEQTVELKHTLAAHLPPVYSTPDMIRLMEIAAFKACNPIARATKSRWEPLSTSSTAPPAASEPKIWAEGVLESFDGKFYTVRVTAQDDTQEIGRGAVGRAVVSVGKFLEKMKKVSS
jgi:predicted thioesterase